MTSTVSSVAVRDGLAVMGGRPLNGRDLSMSEETAPTTGTEETNSQTTENAKEFEAITSQEDFDKAIQARLARERAKFADYPDLKARADKFAEWENSQKTEAQKNAEALEAAQRELSEERVARARAEVAATKGVPAELLSGATREELEKSAEALIEFRGEQGQQKLHVPTEGGSPAGSALNGDPLLAALKSKLGID